MILGVQAKVQQMIRKARACRKFWPREVTAPYDAKVPGGLLPAGAGPAPTGLSAWCIRSSRAATKLPARPQRT